MPPADKSSGSLVLAAALLSLAALAWAGNYVVGRWVAGVVPPGGLALGRWLVAMLVLLVMASPHLRRDWPVLASCWRYLLVMGITGAGIFGTLQYAALQYTTATNGGLLSATSPVLIALAGAFMFGDRLTSRQAGGLALAMLGAVVIVIKGDPANLAGLRFNVGDLMLLFTLACWGVYSALLRKRPAVHWTSFTLAVFAVALVGNVPVVIVEHMLGRPLEPTLHTLGAVLYTGLVSSVVGFIAWNRGVEIIGSPRAGVYLNLIPILTVLLAVALLGERLQGFHIVACLLVFGGLWLATTSAGPRRGAS
jgi:drug/metabolite transporter (DMT)-like permease